MVNPVLHVGILTEKEIRFTLEGAFGCSGMDGELTGSFVARREGNGILLKGEHGPAGLRQEFLFEPLEAARSAFVLEDVTIGVQFHWQRKERQRFVGSLALVRDGAGIVAVNVVSVEDYLTSVISSEMSAASSLQLLKAHAITSRSWLLAQLEKSRRIKETGERYQTAFETNEERVRWYDREDHALFDVCADDHCQRYQGITKAYTPVVREAVGATAGQVLVHDGHVCDARFSKSCGGVSEAFENVWEPVHHPYLTPVVDSPEPPAGFPLDLPLEEKAEQWIRGNPPAFCNTRDPSVLSQVLVKFDQETTDFFRWRVSYRQNELAELIHRKSGIDFGRILDLVPIQRGASSRLTRLKVVGTTRTLIIGKELEIRRTLSPTHLYSAAFVVEKSGERDGIPGEFHFVGAGWGHGVGLCQIGAAVMGECGYSHDRILAHYFKGAIIQKLY